jgi:hypothetical protein
MNALTRLSLLAACVLMAPAAHAASGSPGALSPANSAEMQSLLAGQIGKLPVRFSNRGPAGRNPRVRRTIRPRPGRARHGDHPYRHV